MFIAHAVCFEDLRNEQNAKALCSFRYYECGRAFYKYFAATRLCQDQASLGSTRFLVARNLLMMSDPDHVIIEEEARAQPNPATI